MPQLETIKGLEFLRTELNNNIDGFRAVAAKSKKRALQMRISMATFGSFTTLLLGLKSSPLFVGYDSEFSAIALVISALIPILTAWDAFVDNRWLWVSYTAAHTSLSRILEEVDFASAKGSVSEEQLGNFHDQFKRAIQAATDSWLDKRSKVVEGDSTKSQAS
jgi:hypothetical protein